MRRRLKAAWAAFLKPPTGQRIEYTITGLDPGGAEIMRAIQRRRRGPTGLA